MEFFNRENILYTVCNRLGINLMHGYFLISMQNWYKNKWYVEQIADYESDWFCVQTAYDFFDFTLPGLEKSYKCLEKKDIAVIMDIGAGTGLSTIFLKKNLKGKRIIYNSNSIKQSNIFADVRKEYSVREDSSEINKLKEEANCIVLFEFLEHFEKPMKIFEMLTRKTKCKYVLMQNSFGGFGYGHYMKYLLNGKWIGKNDYKNAFLQELKKNWIIKPIKGSRVYFLTKR